MKNYIRILGIPQKSETAAKTKNKNTIEWRKIFSYNLLIHKRILKYQQHTMLFTNAVKEQLNFYLSKKKMSQVKKHIL